jgi:hypothetical protein
MDGMSAADMAAVTGRNGDWDNGLWLFAILALMGGGFGGWGNRGYQPQYATQDFVQNGFNFNDLQDQNREIMQAVTSGTAQAVAATNQVYHDVVGYVGDKYMELQRDVSGLAIGQANLLAHQNECSSAIARQLAEMKYDAAMRDAATNANIVAQAQRMLDAYNGNKMEAMQNRINQLELQNQLQGVVRYPNGWTYNAGNNPFCGGNCNM